MFLFFSFVFIALFILILIFAFTKKTQTMDLNTLEDLDLKNTSTLEHKIIQTDSQIEPDQGGKIGIFCHGQHGDIAVITGVFKHRNELWPGKDIVWFATGPIIDIFKFNPFVEIREYAQGWDLPERCTLDGPDNIHARANGLPLFENWAILKKDNCRLDLSKKHLFERTKDLTDGYFPAPHHMSASQREGIEYSNVSRKVFGIPLDIPWHPMLFWSDEEREMIRLFHFNLPYKKTILFETFGGSGQTRLNDRMIRKTLQLINNHSLNINIIFVSHKYVNQAFGSETFPDDILKMNGVVQASHFTVRQTALLINYTDLMICVSSGISVVTSAWGLKPTPKLQFCGSVICSTAAIGSGPVHLVTSNDITDDLYVENIFYNRLAYVLQEYI
jgi:hypothetical protein